MNIEKCDKVKLVQQLDLLGSERTDDYEEVIKINNEISVICNILNRKFYLSICSNYMETIIPIKIKTIKDLKNFIKIIT